MARKRTDYALLDMAWGFYVENPSPMEVQRRCAAAGYDVHRNTVNRWVNKGIPSAEVEAFKKRLQRIKQAAELLTTAAPPKPPRVPQAAQVEIVRSQTPEQRLQTIGMIDALAAQYAASNLEDWRAEMNRTLGIVRVTNDLVMECVMGADPEDHVAVRNATGALKNAVSAMRGAIESNAVINTQGSGNDGDDLRDEWVQQNFKGWTAEEHRAFRDNGIWPERLGPPPAFLISPAEPEDGE